MRKFNKKEMEVLAEYENTLSTAYRLDFKHHTSNQINEKVADIYEAAGGTVHRNWTCNYCIMQLWKQAGKLYFETKEAEEKPKRQYNKKTEK